MIFGSAVRGWRTAGSWQPWYRRKLQYNSGAARGDGVLVRADIINQCNWFEEEIIIKTLKLKSQIFKPKERDIQKQIKEYLQWTGFFVVKIHQSLGSYPGIADLYAIKNGRSIWIEVKTATGKQSPAQKEFQRQVEEHGGTYILARKIEDVNFQI